MTSCGFSIRSLGLLRQTMAVGVGILFALIISALFPLALAPDKSASFAGQVDEASGQVTRNMAAMEHFIRGVVADKMEDYYRAVFEYQEALEADPTACAIYVALAQDYVILGKVPQALELLAKALEIDPDYKAALELRAGLLLNTERWLESLTLYERLAQLDSSDVEYPYQLLRLYLQRGDFERADAMYERVVALEGETKQLLLQMTTALLLSENPQRARPYLERVSELDTADAAAIYTLGTLHLQSADTILAQANFERAIALRPDIARFWMGLALLQMDQNDYEGACQTLGRAIEQIPANAGLWSLLGSCQNQQGKTDDAIISLEQSLELDSTNFSALGVLALIYAGTDSISKIRKLYERAIQLSDSAAIFLNNYAYTLAERALDLAHAKEMAEKACAAEPKNASFLDTMGWILFKMGDNKSAIQWLRKALKYEPQSAPILEHLGDVHSARGAKSKARGYYRKALKYDPQNESLRQKLGL